MMEEKQTKGDIGADTFNPLVSAAPVEKPGDATLSSYDVFEKCIRRAENLVSFQASTDKIEGLSEEHYCDSYRAAVVLSISALDAFIRKVLVSEIRKAISGKQPLVPKLGDYIKSLLDQDKLLDAARKYDLLEQVENAIKIDFETKSFQGELKIASFMEMVGHKEIFSQVSVKVNVNEKNLRRNLSLYTTRRHVIAHSGDYDLNSNPHKENAIDKKYADECISTVKVFAKTIHEIVENK
jgi:hypothetical protein